MELSAQKPDLLHNALFASLRYSRPGMAKNRWARQCDLGYFVVYYPHLLEFPEYQRRDGFERVGKTAPMRIYGGTNTNRCCNRCAFHFGALS